MNVERIMFEMILMTLASVCGIASVHCSGLWFLYIFRPQNATCSVCVCVLDTNRAHRTVTNSTARTKTNNILHFQFGFFSVSLLLVFSPFTPQSSTLQPWLRRPLAAMAMRQSLFSAGQKWGRHCIATPTNCEEREKRWIRWINVSLKWLWRTIDQNIWDLANDSWLPYLNPNQSIWRVESDGGEPFHTFIVVLCKLCNRTVSAHSMSSMQMKVILP